jgi:tetratricopeptide (TPR) repeat protein
MRDMFVCVEIDLTAKQCTLSHDPSGTGTKTCLKRKGFEFLCLLLASDNVEFVSKEDVHRLPSWNAMKVQSVGKQVARLIARLSESGFDIIDYTKKTEAWRVKPNLVGLRLEEARTAAKAYLGSTDWERGLRFSDSSSASVANWMSQNVKALLEMTSGNAEVGYDELKIGFAQANSQPLQAISNVIATRIGQRLPSPHLPLPSEYDRFATMFELAVEARRIAAYASRSKSTEWGDFADQLQRLLPKVSQIGDTTTQAIIHNAQALIFRRQGFLDKALDSIKEAAPLAVFSGDLILIQNVVFNFGNILSEVRRITPDVCSHEDFFALIELDIAIRNQFNLGRDSAQAELLAAYLHYENRNWTKARHYLDLAQDIIGISSQPCDLALFHRVNGLLLIATSQPSSDQISCGRAELQISMTIFRQIGNEPAYEIVKAEFQACEEPAYAD